MLGRRYRERETRIYNPPGGSPKQSGPPRESPRPCPYLVAFTPLSLGEAINGESGCGQGSSRVHDQSQLSPCKDSVSGNLQICGGLHGNIKGMAK
ncbi:hypothetical protein chiPu_0006563 [Chiloscyllium punctatum]|uniref:Uncharacterized protein n=1 Tax=Chiloscyllium punctatum TaxID=137246 RepID=A0A401SCJ9_CHIPU|nr:hypothetical protein [Chiloscyllium punctatum]